MDNEIKTRILQVLLDLYNDNPTAIISTAELAKKLKISIKEAQGGLIYLKEKDLINSYNRGEVWHQKISAYGIDELQKIKSDSRIKSQTTEDSLDLDVEDNAFQGNMHVFISHKFVKKDQELALILKKRLLQDKIGGYLAEQNRDFDIPINQKIRDKIDASDYLIAIITEFSANSPSVNQEIGYALGTGCPIRIMVETKEVPGILIGDRELEEFSRKNFEKKLGVIINDIINNGPRKKIKTENMQQLIQNVYEPCYNQMMNVYNTREFISEIPPNPWKDKISHTWKLKTEVEIKDIFEEYSKELDIWHKMFVEWENTFSRQEKKIADSVSVAFVKVNLLDQYKYIILDDTHTISPKDWVHKFRFVLFDPDITNATKLHQRLVEFAKQTDDYHVRWLDRFSARTDLFRIIMFILPTIRAELNPTISNEEIKLQREKLKIIIEKLIPALEERLK